MPRQEGEDFKVKKFEAGDDYTKRLRRDNGLPESASLEDVLPVVTQMIKDNKPLEGAGLILNRWVGAADVPNDSLLELAINPFIHLDDKLRTLILMRELETTRRP